MTPVDRFRDRRVLITGGLGFLGSNLAGELVAAGAHVTLYDALLDRCGGNLVNVAPFRERVKIHVADLRDNATLASVVRDQDYIFHLAGHVGHTDSMSDPHFDWEVNCLSTLNLLEACLEHNPSARLLYTSTRQVYGKPQALPVSEDHAAIPIDVNGIHKLTAENYHLLYDRVYGLWSTVLRLTNTFGPRQKIVDAGAGFAGFFIYRALRGETIQLYGGGSQLRDLNYVDDVVRALMLAITTDACRGRVLNLGANRAYALRDVASHLREFCDFPIEEIPFPSLAHMIEIGDYYGDFSRFREACGWAPEVSLRDGLAHTIEYYRRHAQAYGL